MTTHAENEQLARVGPGTITGDLMRVGGMLVRIEGVEAPAPSQPCYRPNGRRWGCAAAARAGLDRIVRGRSVTCTADRKSVV